MISDFIVPLFASKDLSSFIGTAFCINNFLITAGHVVPHYRIYYTYTKDSRRFLEIYPDNWLIRQHPKESNLEHDVAICRLERFKSEILLSTSPIFDTKVDVVCWQKDRNSTKMVYTEGLVCETSDKNPELYKLVTCNRITHGSSGCPILQDNKVVGMLTIGVDKCTLDTNAYLIAGASQEQIDEFQRNEEKVCYILRPEYIKKILDSALKCT